MNYGMVAEFNPFHKGHKYIVDLIKENSSNTVTAVMSESFVQRGESAIMSPYARTKAALESGVDLVLSLPVTFATSSAENFSYGGVKILDSLGFIDKIAFGSECGDKEALIKISKCLEDENIIEKLKEYLADGKSFPKARELAIGNVLGKKYSDILKNPNDILGIEYTKALLKLNSKIEIQPVKRIGAMHDSKDEIGEIVSASFIREKLNNKENIKEFLNKESADILDEALKNGQAPADFKNLEKAILYKLRTMRAEDFSKLPDVSEGLEFKIAAAIRTGRSLDEILEKIKTKRYTLSRIRRIIIYAFLGITKEDMLVDAPYIRVLGFNEKGASLLKEAKELSVLPIVTKYSDINNLGEDAKRIFSLEAKARDIFSLSTPVIQECGKEMTDKIIVL